MFALPTGRSLSRDRVVLAQGSSFFPSHQLGALKLGPGFTFPGTHKDAGRGKSHNGVFQPTDPGRKLTRMRETMREALSTLILGGISTPAKPLADDE